MASALVTAQIAQAAGEVLYCKFEFAALEADLRALRAERARVHDDAVAVAKLERRIDEVSRQIRQTGEELQHSQRLLARLGFLYAKHRATSWAWRKLTGEKFERLERPFVGPVQPGRFMSQKSWGFRVR